MRRVHTFLLLGILTALSRPAGAGISSGLDPDSLYLHVHPRLAFTRAEIPALRSKLHDGGADDDAYATLRGDVTGDYATATFSDLMDITYGMNIPLDAGLVAYLDDTGGETARDVGRRFTLALADSFVADDDPFYTSIRLRALCYGYDLCLENASSAERASVRSEIESYVDSLMFAFNFERWLHPPYTSNKTAMTGAALGIAAICLADEMDPGRVTAALARADQFVETWIHYQLDRDGSCFEGIQYGGWAMRHLAWYFEARRRYDGVDYSQRDDIRRIERWLAYEVLPETGGTVNNLNETAYLNYPMSRFNTCIEWAMARRKSPLAAWLWDRLVGPVDGHDAGTDADRAATVLWHAPVSPVNPGRLLAPSFLWKERGLYYYRSGWPDQGGSDDVVFSFSAGPFHGGHSQEDQGSFTLYAYGTRFAADNGYEESNGVSEAHNIVFIDGKGQHFSGRSVGTDGEIVTRVFSGYADYLFGNVTTAYTTHSPYNDPGVPFPDDDWSYGYSGANPVEHAWREWLVVHEDDTPAYFVLLDDVSKDDMSRTYQWRMHADNTLSIDLSSDPLRVTGPRGSLAIDICHPAAGDLDRSITPFINTSVDPSTNVIQLTQQTARGVFALVLRPQALTGNEPVATPAAYAWGGTDVIAWPGGITDVVLAHAGTDTIEATVTLPDHRDLFIRTDARILHLRTRTGEPARSVFAHATVCDVGDIEMLRTNGPAATVIVAGERAYVDRADARFTLYAPDVHRLHAGDVSLSFSRNGMFITRSDETPAGPSRAPALQVYPQPARGPSTIVVEVDRAGPASIDIFDVAGRRVRTLDTTLDRGRTLIPFDGRDSVAIPLASGVYFARVRSGGRSAMTKIVLVR